MPHLIDFPESPFDLVRERWVATYSEADEPVDPEMYVDVHVLHMLTARMVYTDSELVKEDRPPAAPALTKIEAMTCMNAMTASVEDLVTMVGGTCPMTDAMTRMKAMTASVEDLATMLRDIRGPPKLGPDQDAAFPKAAHIQFQPAKSRPLTLVDEAAEAGDAKNGAGAVAETREAAELGASLEALKEQYKHAQGRLKLSIQKINGKLYVKIFEKDRQISQSMIPRDAAQADKVFRVMKQIMTLYGQNKITKAELRSKRDEMMQSTPPETLRPSMKRSAAAAGIA